MRKRKKRRSYFGSGRTACVCQASGVVLAVGENDWMYEWSQIGTQLAYSANPAYLPAYIYVEYRNLSNPSDTAPIPTISRVDGLRYYLNLVTPADYLRLPVLTRSLGRDSSYAGTQYMSSGTYNMLTLIAQTTGSTGVHGLPYSNAANSKIYGIAVAAGPVPSDHTQDVVWGRSYYAGGDQFVVPSAGAVQVTYNLTFM